MPAIGRMPMMTAIHKSEPSPAHGNRDNDSWVGWEKERRTRGGSRSTPEQVQEHLEAIAKANGKGPALKYTAKRKIV